MKPNKPTESDFAVESYIASGQAKAKAPTTSAGAIAEQTAPMAR